MPISKDKASVKPRVSRSHAGDKSIFGTVKARECLPFWHGNLVEKRVILLPHTPNLNYSPHKG
jgi:hypothetical protein